MKAFLRAFLRALGTTALLFFGATLGWMLIGIFLPIELPKASLALVVWIVTMGLVFMIEVMCSFGEGDDRRDRR